jgi:pimeloyl-ACP methyl ester carboxylesterase
MGNLAVVEGHGDTRVLVLHGWALDSAVWLASRNEIDLERFTYAFLDFSGYGPARDEAGSPASGIDGMAEEAIAAADELGWDTFAVLGHSMGGATAIRVATLAPDRVKAVVCLTPVSPSGTPLDAATYEAFRSAYPDSGPTLGGLDPRLSARQLQNIVSRSHQVLDQGVWDAYLANWSAADFGDSLALYDGPVTLAYGDSDPFVTKEYLAGTAQALKNASLVPIESAGHYPMVEQTVQTVLLWEDALTNETGRQSA